MEILEACSDDEGTTETILKDILIDGGGVRGVRCVPMTRTVEC